MLTPGWEGEACVPAGWVRASVQALRCVQALWREPSPKAQAGVLGRVHQRESAEVLSACVGGRSRRGMRPGQARARE